MQECLGGLWIQSFNLNIGLGYVTSVNSYGRDSYMLHGLYFEDNIKTVYNSIKNTVWWWIGYISYRRYLMKYLSIDHKQNVVFFFIYFWIFLYERDGWSWIYFWRKHICNKIILFFHFSFKNFVLSIESVITKTKQDK
jgi:hypothetical protein